MTQDTFLGIEIGGSKLQLVIGGAGKIMRRWRRTVDPAGGAPAIRSQIEALLGEILGSTHPRGIGVGFGGPVDWQTGCIACSHQIEGWSGFDIAAWLARLTKLPVAVDNDANVAALGEATHGAGRTFDPVFYVTLGSGVGGGLVLAQQIYHGAKPGEAEIGHVRLDRSGGTVEARCSGWAVDRRIRSALLETPSAEWAAWAGPTPGGEAKHLKAALEKGDPLARQMIQEVAADLAFALSHVAHLVHPEVIVLGGGLALVGEPLRRAVADELPRQIMEVFRPGPQIALAGLSEDAVPVGALELAKSSCSKQSASPVKHDFIDP